MEVLDKAIDFVRDKPLVGVGVAGGVALVLIAANRRSEPASAEQSSGSSGYGVNGSPLLSQYTGSNVPVLMNYTPSLPPPGDQSNPGTELVTLMREGRAVNVTAGPPSICPPGYVSVQQPGQPPRCSLVNDATKKPGQRTTFFPSRGEGAYISP